MNESIMLYFHYCSPAWPNAAPFWFTRKVVNTSNFIGRENNCSIYNVINNDMSLLIFKPRNNNIAPNHIYSKINMARNCYSHNTRRAAKNHIQPSSTDKKFGLKQFACLAPKLWND